MRPGSTPWRRSPRPLGSAAPRSTATSLALTPALVRNVPSARDWLKLEECANEPLLGMTASSTRLGGGPAGCAWLLARYAGGWTGPRTPVRYSGSVGTWHYPGL